MKANGWISYPLAFIYPLELFLRIEFWKFSPREMELHGRKFLLLWFHFRGLKLCCSKNFSLRLD
jgi:hypothetical protein